MKIRIPILPFTVTPGKIQFNTVEMTFILDANGERKHRASDEGCLDYRIVPGDKMTIYLDSSMEPLFSPTLDKKAWCSPTLEKRRMAEESGQEIDTVIIVSCKCQKSSELSYLDIESLEQCGHTSICEHSKKKASTTQLTQETIDLGRTVQEDAFQYIQPPSETQPSKPVEEFCPPDGIPVQTTLSSLLAYLQGTEGSISNGLEAIGWNKPYSLDVVIKELVKFYKFTQCQKCAVWDTVESLSNPLCGSCRGGK